MATTLESPRPVRAAPRIESLLSSRLFLAPQLVGDRIFFISNISGALSLYAMDAGGSVPEPLLPPEIALQNPELMPGKPFFVFPGLETVVVMIDHDGDEIYQPMRIALEGGIPEPAFGDAFADKKAHLGHCDVDTGRLYIVAESRAQALIGSYACDLQTGDVRLLRESQWGSFVDGVAEDHARVTMIDGYTFGDQVLYVWEAGGSVRRIYGVPIEVRAPGQEVAPNGIAHTTFLRDGKGLLCTSVLFDDARGLTYVDLDRPDVAKPVPFLGATHSGSGEMVELSHLHDDAYTVTFNIDGASWVYEAAFDAGRLEMTAVRALVGEGELAGGTLEALYYDKAGDRFCLSFSTATSPTQIYWLDGPERAPVRHTRERILGIAREWMAAGEDASFTSHDGLRVSARLYLPAEELGHEPPFPLVYYVHGGPQSQERPNFAWFSIPLIQFLTLSGFAVFVPNVRGSTGYGFDYMKRVEHDWGGQDRLDHVFAMEHVLPKDARLDTGRTGVMGRSYGGFMTLTLAGRHPTLWAAAIDMFGPYDLFTFVNRLPETQKPFARIVVGDPEKEPEFMRERSPSTYIDGLTCPMLVIQGRNDPRVLEQESRDVVERLQSKGKEVSFLVFENEGHDVLKFENRVRCYNEIRDFFREKLGG